MSGEPDTAKWNYGPAEPAEPWNVGHGGTAELNGTYDMMGNLYEWTESPWDDPTYAADADRALRGGGFYSTSDGLASSYRHFCDLTDGEGSDIGFRVAAEVPEPATTVLLVAGLAALAARRKRRSRP